MVKDVAERFEALRPLLVRHAYRMLGEYGEAEDAVQDAYFRWNDAAKRGTVQNDQAFLRTTVTHLCLDRLRSARHKREVYVGPWLPEPVVSHEDGDPADAASLADDISFALLLALERLAPLERAAFLLHDVLDVPFAEVAQTLGRSEPAVRKLASRAREHVRDGNRRAGVERAKALHLRDSFLEALLNEDAAALGALLAEDVVFTSDGGGKVPAAMVPVAGSERVSALVLGLKRKGWHHVRRVRTASLNGMPGIITFNENGPDTAVALEIAHGRIVAMYAVRNPEKLTFVARTLAESR